MINYILTVLGIRSNKTGGDVVAEVASTFDTMVEKLSGAVADIDNDIEFNQGRITELKSKNTVLGADKVKGLNLIRGIEGLINGS